MNSILKTSLLFLAIGSFQAISCSDAKTLRAKATETQKSVETKKSPQKEDLRKKKPLEDSKKAGFIAGAPIGSGLGAITGTIVASAAWTALFITKKLNYIDFLGSDTSSMIISFGAYFLLGGYLGTVAGGYIGSSATAPDNDEDNDNDDESAKESTQETALTEKKLPVLIAHSSTDSHVNIRSAWQNYKAFKEAGFNNDSHVNIRSAWQNYKAVKEASWI